MASRSRSPQRKNLGKIPYPMIDDHKIPNLYTPSGQVDIYDRYADKIRLNWYLGKFFLEARYFIGQQTLWDNGSRNMFIFAEQNDDASINDRYTIGEFFPIDRNTAQKKLDEFISNKRYCITDMGFYYTEEEVLELDPEYVETIFYDSEKFDAVKFGKFHLVKSKSA